MSIWFWESSDGKLCVEVKHVRDYDAAGSVARSDAPAARDDHVIGFAGFDTDDCHAGNSHAGS